MTPEPNLTFGSNSRPTLGVELELQLLDPETLALRSGVLPLIEALPPEARHWVKPELMQCYIEINTGVCQSVREVERDLREKLGVVRRAAEASGNLIYWGGTHPFSHWQDQEITPDPRYDQLVETMQDTARRVVIFGMHIHVGVDSGDKAIMVLDRLQRHLSTFLALSVNSPFWVGRRTGLMSHRIKIMEQLPAAGLPPIMRNWSEYCWVVNQSLQTGFINSIREIWWDVRPHPGFGTVELRICDLPWRLEDVLGLTALAQCLVTALSDQVDRGLYQHDIHPITVRQNKWKASRFGLEADLIDPVTFRTVPVRQATEELLDLLRPYARDLDCTDELEHLTAMAEGPSGSQQQVRAFEELGDLRSMIHEMMRKNPLTA